MLADFLNVVITREDVASGNTSSTLEVLSSLMSSPQRAIHWRERIDVAFDGYDDTTLELFEIPEVRNFVLKLDEKFPFWLFFLSKSHFGLQCIMLCFLPPFLTLEGKAKIFPSRIQRLLEDRWIPAMNHVCEFVGMSDSEIELMTDRVVEYIRAA